MHRLEELVRLHRLNTGCREVARLIGVSPNTERQYRHALEAEGLLCGEATALPPLEALLAAVTKKLGPTAVPAQNSSSIAQWHDEIQTMLDRGAGPGSIYDVLRLRDDFTGSLSAVKRVCVRIKRERGVSEKDVVIPINSEPGECAQVDFGYVGKLYDPLEGVDRRAWVFVMVLAHSRHMYAEIVFDQKAETWIDLHIRAFHTFGGVVELVRPDNLKAAVIRAAFNCNDDIALNRTYRELAKHYGFKIDPTPPRQPKKKGKVESAVKYIKNNFFKPRALKEVGEAREQLKVWVREIAGTRTHGTTGRRPLDVFEGEEKETLTTLPVSPYELIEWKKATVHSDCHVQFGKRLYSVPWKLVNHKLWVRASPRTVMVFDGVKRVATHARHGETLRSTVEEHLPDHRRDYRHRKRSYWEERAAQLGEPVAAYIKAVFDADDVLYQLRTVQQIVKHLETFPKDRARNACKRALYFENFKYKAIKNILRKGLDMEPFDPATIQPAPSSTPSRFARSASELVNPNLELFKSSDGENHEYH